MKVPRESTDTQDSLLSFSCCVSHFVPLFFSLCLVSRHLIDIRRFICRHRISFPSFSSRPFSCLVLSLVLASSVLIFIWLNARLPCCAHPFQDNRHRSGIKLLILFPVEKFSFLLYSLSFEEAPQIRRRKRSDIRQKLPSPEFPVNDFIAFRFPRIERSKELKDGSFKKNSRTCVTHFWVSLTRLSCCILSSTFSTVSYNETGGRRIHMSWLSHDMQVVLLPSSLAVTLFFLFSLRVGGGGRGSYTERRREIHRKKKMRLCQNIRPDVISRETFSSPPLLPVEGGFLLEKWKRVYPWKTSWCLRRRW